MNLLSPAALPDLLRLVDVLPMLEAAEHSLGQRHAGPAAAAPAGGGESPASWVELLQARLHAQLSERALEVARVVRSDGRRFEQAYAHALKAKEHLERSGDRAQAVQAAINCVAICIEAGDFGRALDHLRVAQRSARDTGDMPLLARLLLKQATAFLCMDEFHAATRCCEDVLRVASDARQAALSDTAEIASAVLGFSRCALADALERSGRAADAQVERRRATECLPISHASSPFESLYLVIHARTRLGDLLGARATATIFLRRARGMPRLPRWMAQVWMTMGFYYQHTGRPEKSAGRLERAVRAMRAAGQDDKLPDTLAMLASAHAANGRHAQALHWLKEARAARRRTQHQHERLRYRLAALERDEQARRLEHETALLHAQRLAVVGRLMAQIYHALVAPLHAAHHLLGDTVVRASALDDAALADALRHVVACIDEASGLTRQLKIFSYRATPQTMTVDLPLALQEAWQGLAIGGTRAAQPLLLHDAPPFQVRGDVQRLAVLLRILLIELEAHVRPAAPRVTLSANGTAVRAVFACAELAAPASVASVGFTLCEEIAREMQGRVWRMDSADGESLVALELPAER